MSHAVEQLLARALQHQASSPTSGTIVGNTLRYHKNNALDLFVRKTPTTPTQHHQRTAFENHSSGCHHHHPPLHNNIRMEVPTTIVAPPAAAAAAVQLEDEHLVADESEQNATTETAASAAAHAPETNRVNTATVIPNLLREWNYPPVAPAVMLPEESTGTTTSTGGGSSAPSADAQVAPTTPQSHRRIALLHSSSGGYSYPVATFVRDLVRSSATAATTAAAAAATATTSTTAAVAATPTSATGTSTLTAVASNTTSSASHDENEETGATLPLSVRSENDASLLTASSSSEPPPQPPPTQDLAAAAAAAPAVSARSADLLDELDEFILVDGDIIEIPPDPPNEEEREAYEFHLRLQEDERPDRKTCHTASHSRMRRGVRRLAKFVKRRTRLFGKSTSGTDSTRSALTIPEEDTSFAAAGPSVAAAVTPLEQQEQEGTTTSPTNSTPPTPGCGTDGTAPHQSRANPPNSIATAAAAAAREMLTGTGSSERSNNSTSSNKSPKRWGRPRRMKRKSWKRSNSGEHSLDEQQDEATGDGAAHDEQHCQGSAEAQSAEGTLSALSPLVGEADTAMPLLMTPIHETSAGSAAGRSQSVTASYMGPADQLCMEAGVLPATASTLDTAAVAYIEYEDPLLKKEDDDMPISVLPRDADYKVDKADAPTVESMLRRAHVETLDESGEEPATLPVSKRARAADGKSTGLSVPLSAACATDISVHNDVLKVMLVGAPGVDKSWLAKALRRTTNTPIKAARPRKRSTLTVDVHSWTPSGQQSDQSDGAASASATNNTTLASDNMPSPVKFMIWDVQGSALAEGDPTMANFGAHPGTQSLFFSAKALYLLVWDLACHNPQTHRQPEKAVKQHVSRQHTDDDDSSSTSSSSGIDEDDHDDDDDLFGREEANRQADRALDADISTRVLAWVDTIAAAVGDDSAILPVCVIPPDMSPAETNRRCDRMQVLLEQHVHKMMNLAKTASSTKAAAAAPAVHHQPTTTAAAAAAAAAGGPMQPFGFHSIPKLLTGAENILRVDYVTAHGLEQLQETILAIATDPSRLVFNHVGTPVPAGTVQVLATLRRLKQDHKLILLDHLLGELGAGTGRRISVPAVIEALHFLSCTGEILYFGCSDDDVLSRYIILSRKWLVSALSCILRNDLKRELDETRRFMNMQCIYSKSADFTVSPLTEVLTDGPNHHCPVLSDKDANMLWQSMSFMREAADQTHHLTESSTPTPSMFTFLQRLLVHTGIFLPLPQLEFDETPAAAATLDQYPLHHDSLSGSDLLGGSRPQVFFVPSLLAQADPRGDAVWSYKSNDSWMTTLSHSWLFRDGAPSDLMEWITVRLLADLFSFSQRFSAETCAPAQLPSATVATPMATSVASGTPHRAQTVPLGRSSLHSFYHDHDQKAVGRIKIHQVMCWKSTLLLKIGTVFCDEATQELRESFVEIFVTVTDPSCNPQLCVASDAMRAGHQRVIVSGKGQVGRHGRKMWAGGYRTILESVRSTLQTLNIPNVDAQVVCPECLAHSNPSSASTWSWDSVRAAAELSQSSSVIRCIRGHRVDSHLVCGTCQDEVAPKCALTMSASACAALDSAAIPARVPAHKSVSEMLPATVLVGCYDSRQKELRSVGSGFVVDKKLGLIVTAGHVLYSMKEGRDFGTPYFGIPDAKVVIGVIPNNKNDTAVFRYFAEIVTHDIHHVDACVCKIVSRMENDVDDEGQGCADQLEKPIRWQEQWKQEKLTALKLTSRYELEESVRVLGFNQGGEGVLEKGKHVNRSPDLAKGYICKRFESGNTSASSHGNASSSALDDCSSQSSSDTSAGPFFFSPREEIVIMCPTISGHSGGPCVNEEGKVIGILSRADPVDRQRCYLVPATEMKLLVHEARLLVLPEAESHHGGGGAPIAVAGLAAVANL